MVDHQQLAALFAADLSDSVNRLVLADALLDVGRDSEASMLRECAPPDLFVVEGRVYTLTRSVEDVYNVRPADCGLPGDRWLIGQTTAGFFVAWSPALSQPTLFCRSMDAKQYWSNVANAIREKRNWFSPEHIDVILEDFCNAYGVEPNNVEVHTEVDDISGRTIGVSFRSRKHRHRYGTHGARSYPMFRDPLHYP